MLHSMQSISQNMGKTQMQVLDITSRQGYGAPLDWEQLLLEVQISRF